MTKAIRVLSRLSVFAAALLLPVLTTITLKPLSMDKRRGDEIPAGVRQNRRKF